MALYNYWPVVVGNLRKAWKKWARMSRILEREWADARTLVTFFKDVVQAFLLFGSEIWVLTPCMGWTLGRFQHRVARRLMGKNVAAP